jgi:hypothetical protein
MDDIQELEKVNDTCVKTMLAGMMNTGFAMLLVTASAFILFTLKQGFSKFSTGTPLYVLLTHSVYHQ